MSDLTQLHITLGWSSMLLGILSGAVMGLFFHREDWAGGYGSFTRRMMRLAHVAFFGLGFLNISFGLSLQGISLIESYSRVASYGLILGAVSMPVCCLLAAWRKPLRHLFPVPVLCLFAGIVPIVLGGLQS